MATTGELVLQQLLFGGTLLVLLMAGAFVLFFVRQQQRAFRLNARLLLAQTQYQRQLLAQSIAAQEQEKARIGQDLHDELGSTLAAIKLMVNHAQNTSPDGPQRELLTQVNELLGDTVQDVRNVAHALYPALLRRFGLTAALQQLGQVSTRTFPGDILVAVEYDQGLSPTQELAVYRMAQELLSNALRHGRGASRIDVELLRPGPTLLRLRVRDNGCGFDYAARRAAPTGVGLSSLEARANLLGAQLSFCSGPAEGTCAQIEFPFSPPA